MVVVVVVVVVVVAAVIVAVGVGSELNCDVSTIRFLYGLLCFMLVETIL